MKRSFLILLLVLQINSGALAAEGFYTVKELPTATEGESISMDPVVVAQDLWEEVSQSGLELKRQFYSLVEFDFHAQKFGDITEPYKRQKHFGSWIVDSRQGSCLNTRAQVLVRDSRAPVQMRPSGCTVDRGLWADPYTGRDYQEARDIQIDHFVPLKNAFLSGAFKWSQEKRCLYANFMGNPFHLLSVLGRENGAKGDRTPESYMPPNPSYQCQYLAQWLKVKLIWSLALKVSEKDQIMKLAQANHCTVDELTYTVADLERQRRFIADNMGLCR